MKCYICKYKNAALEAEKHSNGLTIFFANALRKKATDSQTCDSHKDAKLRGQDMTAADKALSNAKSFGYIPLENIWHQLVHIPKGERL